MRALPWTVALLADIDDQPESLEGAMSMFSIRIGGALLLVGLSCFVARAQDYPNRPITIIVPFAAGGPSDVLARNLASAMTPALKQHPIIENVGGGGGTLGIARASRAH